MTLGVACIAALASFAAVFGSPLPAAASGTPETPITESCLGGGVGHVCGTLNPGSSAKVGWYFAYDVGSSCDGSGSGATGSGEVEGEGVQVAAQLEGLKADTTYSYCLVATSEGAEAFGSALTFHTPPLSPEPPEAPVTEACSGPFVPGHVCGTLNPNSSAKVGWYFDYNVGSSCTGGAQTAQQGEAEGHEVAVDAQLTGLLPGTAYTYCLVAENAAGSTRGGGLSFSTPPSGSVTDPPQNGPIQVAPLPATPSPSGNCGSFSGASKESCERLQLALRRTAERRLQCKKHSRIERKRCLAAVRRKAHTLRNRYRRLMTGST